MNVSSVWPTLMGLSATSSLPSPTLTAYRPRSGYHTTIVPAAPLRSGRALSPDTVTSAPGSSAPPSRASMDTVPERSELILYLWLSMLGGNIVRDSRLSRAERAKSPGAPRTLTSMLASVRRRPTFFSALSSENLPSCWLTTSIPASMAFIMLFPCKPSIMRSTTTSRREGRGCTMVDTRRRCGARRGMTSDGKIRSSRK